MKGTDWGWRPSPTEGIWKHGCKWAHPFTAAAPWVTVAMLFALFNIVDRRLAAASGIVFDLPEPIAHVSTAVPELVALVVPVVRDGDAQRETLVFFDNERYSLNDKASIAALGRNLRESVAAKTSRTLLLLADVRVSTGDLISLTSIARTNGVASVQIAEKRE